jgi:hypothetical protein
VTGWGSVAKDEGGDAVGAPGFEEVGWKGNASGAVDHGAKDEIRIAIAIEVAGIHGQPASGSGFGESGGDELQVSAVLEEDEAFPGRTAEVGEEGDGSDIQVAIGVEIAGDRFESAVEGEEPGWVEAVVPVVEVESKAVVGAERGREIAVVTVSHEEVGGTVVIEIGEFKSGGTVGGREMDERLPIEGAVAEVAEEVKAFAGLAEEDDEIGQAVVVGINDSGAEGSGEGDEGVFDEIALG